MQVAVGYTAIDALAAIVGVLATRGSGSALEQKLQAFQYNFLQTLNDADGTAQLELLIRQAWFGSTPGGTIWDIVPVAQGQDVADPLAQGPIPAPPPLTSEQQQWLAALNITQDQLDRATRDLRTMQWELFALWWNQQRAPHVAPTVFGGRAGPHGGNIPRRPAADRSVHYPHPLPRRTPGRQPRLCGQYKRQYALHPGAHRCHRGTSPA